MKIQNPRSRAYKIFSIIVLVILAILFLFPLYWIVTGAFKPAVDIYNPKPVWWPTEWVTTNFQNLFKKRTAPLFSFFGLEGPVAPGAFRWLINSVFMAVMAMILTCITAAMAGYALAKKRFMGRALLFSLIVCAMALPKQVILIPLLKEMSTLKLYDTLWAVIFPTVGWPFGVFLMKQFSEGIPGEILEATRIDGASEAKTFVPVVLPMVKPGIGALAIFTFINSWNEFIYALVLISGEKYRTLPIALMNYSSGKYGTDYGGMYAAMVITSILPVMLFVFFSNQVEKTFSAGAILK